ncbi:MAG: phosphoribosyltransferase family protein [Opitutaceae bacterium]
MGAPSFTETLRPFARTLRDLVFPPACLSCGGLCEECSLLHVCARCAPLIVRVKNPHCSTCGHPFFGHLEGERICPHCDGFRQHYGAAKTVTLFKGPAREYVLELKYRQGFFVLEDMRTLIAENAEVVEFLQGATLVPVPLHPRKERERTFNQSHLIAVAFQQALGGDAAIANLLQRMVDTDSQTTFDRRTRRQRMKNAFAARKGAAITANQRYVLVDDVFTTGSTLNSCAHALAKAGALNIDVVTFAHG